MLYISIKSDSSFLANDRPFHIENPPIHICAIRSLPKAIPYLTVVYLFRWLLGTIWSWLYLQFALIFHHISTNKLQMGDPGSLSLKRFLVLWLCLMTSSLFLCIGKKKRQLISHFPNQTFPAFIGKHSERDGIYYPFRDLGLHQRLPDGQVQKTFYKWRQPEPLYI